MGRNFVYMVKMKFNKNLLKTLALIPFFLFPSEEDKIKVVQGTGSKYFLSKTKDFIKLVNWQKKII